MRVPVNTGAVAGCIFAQEGTKNDQKPILDFLIESMIFKSAMLALMSPKPMHYKHVRKVSTTVLIPSEIS